MNRLEELKQARTAAVNILECGFAETSEEKQSAKIWIALIDDEIARQSVTDEDVQLSMDYLNDHKAEILAYDPSVGIFAPSAEEMMAIETIEAALRAYRKPTIPIQQIINALQTILDEKLTMGPNDIKELIWHLQNCTSEREPTAEEVVSIDRAIAEIIGTDYGECQMHRETLETAITALRRMKGEA